MYILFLLFGILLYFLINKYDAFFVGVPYIKVYYSDRDKRYYLVNMDNYEPEPQDVGEPTFNGYVDQDTYQTMERNLELDNTRDPRLSPDCIPESIPGVTCELLTDDTILLEIFKTQLVSNSIFSEPESATEEANFMLHVTKLTYQNLIDQELITQEQALEHISKRQDMLRSFRIIPQVQMSASPLQAARSPRLPKECAAHIASFVGSDVLYEWLLRNIDSVDFEILAQYFDPNIYIEFLHGILTNMNIDYNSLILLIHDFYSIYISYIIPIIKRKGIDIAINIFTIILDIFQQLKGYRYLLPNIQYFLWLLENNRLGENHTFDPQYIINTYIDIGDTVGLLEHLLGFTDFANTTQLREFLIDPTDSYKNLLDMLSEIINYLYEHFNAGR